MENDRPPQGSARPDNDSFHGRVKAARQDLVEVHDKINRRMGRDVFVAIGVAVAVGLIALAALLFARPIFSLIVVVVVCLAVFELCRAVRKRGYQISAIAQLIAVVFIMLSAFFWGFWWHLATVFFALFFVVAWQMIARAFTAGPAAEARRIDDIVLAILIPLYIPFLASFVLLLLKYDTGQWWVLSFLILVTVSDTGAYASGLLLGKHAMAPQVSPNKTWEGFAGSVFFALLAGVILAMLLLGLPWWAGLIIGAVIVCTATIGDLAESMIKRSLGVKDMSSWVPGHGGVLDRLDSLLPSAAAAGVLFMLFNPSPVVL